MPDSFGVQIGDKLVAELNLASQAWHLPVEQFTAELLWRPVIKAETLGAALYVAVYQDTLSDEDLDRGRDRLDYGFIIHFQKKVDVSSKGTIRAACNPLDYLVEQVHDYYRQEERPITGLTAWKVIEAHRPGIYDRERLYVDGVFESHLELGIFGVR